MRLHFPTPEPPTRLGFVSCVRRLLVTATLAWATCANSLLAQSVTSLRIPIGSGWSRGWVDFVGDVDRVVQPNEKTHFEFVAITSNSPSRLVEIHSYDATPSYLGKAVITLQNYPANRGGDPLTRTGQCVPIPGARMLCFLCSSGPGNSAPWVLEFWKFTGTWSHHSTLQLSSLPRSMKVSNNLESSGREFIILGERYNAHQSRKIEIVDVTAMSELTTTPATIAVYHDFQDLTTNDEPEIVRGPPVKIGTLDSHVDNYDELMVGAVAFDVTYSTGAPPNFTFSRIFGFDRNNNGFVQVTGGDQAQRVTLGKYASGGFCVLDGYTPLNHRKIASAVISHDAQMNVTVGFFTHDFNGEVLPDHSEGPPTIWKAGVYGYGSIKGLHSSFIARLRDEGPLEYSNRGFWYASRSTSSPWGGQPHGSNLGEGTRHPLMTRYLAYPSYGGWYTPQTTWLPAAGNYEGNYIEPITWRNRSSAFSEDVKIRDVLVTAQNKGAGPYVSPWSIVEWKDDLDDADYAFDWTPVVDSVPTAHSLTAENTVWAFDVCNDGYEEVVVQGNNYVTMYFSPHKSGSMPLLWGWLRSAPVTTWEKHVIGREAKYDK